MAQTAKRPASVMDPTAVSLADVYAEALLGALPDDAQAERVAEELAQLVGLLDELDGAADLLAGALLSTDQRHRLIERVFTGRVCEPLEAVLDTLARRGRVGLLWAISHRYRRKLNARQGKVEVTVTTASALDDEQRQRVADAIAQAIEADPVLTTKVDPALLGGMCVRVGDRLFDASVATDLKRLRKAMADRIEERLGQGGPDQAGRRNTARGPERP